MKSEKAIAYLKSAEHDCGVHGNMIHPADAVFAIELAERELSDRIEWLEGEIIGLKYSRTVAEDIRAEVEAENARLKEAARWRKVEEELPEENVGVLFRIEKCQAYFGARYGDEFIADGGDVFPIGDKGGDYYVHSWQPVNID